MIAGTQPWYIVQHCGSFRSFLRIMKSWIADILLVSVLFSDISSALRFLDSARQIEMSGTCKHLMCKSFLSTSRFLNSLQGSNIFYIGNPDSKFKWHFGSPGVVFCEVELFWNCSGFPMFLLSKILELMADSRLLFSRKALSCTLD